MLSVIQAKVGVVSCSGEELAEGTVSRLATLKVLHELRATQTVTICLPLFLAGGEGDRDFARNHPTITVDGCELRCAAHGTEMYSGRPTASVVVSDLVAAAGLPAPQGRRCLDAAGKEAVELVANRVAQLVDEVLAARQRRLPSGSPATPAAGSPQPSGGTERPGRGPVR